MYGDFYSLSYLRRFQLTVLSHDTSMHFLPFWSCSLTEEYEGAESFHYDCPEVFNDSANFQTIPSNNLNGAINILFKQIHR